MSQRCDCHACIKEHGLTASAMYGESLSGVLDQIPLNSVKMILCPECGNKRCPKASDHRLACTGSNEPGQEGSVYQ